MKLLVCGGSGLVGSHLVRVLAGRGHAVVGTYRGHALPGLERLDLGEAGEVEAVLGRVRPEVVINATGWNWVDGCEGDPARAWRENAEIPGELAGRAAAIGARCLHFSTSYVFDGERGPYGEEDRVNPLSVYARSKLAGERAVLGAAGAAVVRTMGVYGEEAQGKNFVAQVVRALREGRPMRVPSDQLGNASYAGDLAEGVAALVEGGWGGVWHLAGPEPGLARVDFARRIARHYGLDESLVEPVSTAELGQPARRPLHGGLRIDKAREALGFSPRAWVPCAGV